MATALQSQLRGLQEETNRFAKEQLAGRTDLHTLADFPHDVWQSMGRENLLSLSIPLSYGGRGESYLAMTVTGEALVAGGATLGLAVSWLVHLLTARSLILGFGNTAQKEAYLPHMATGRCTASFAVSEPGTGANPKHFATEAFFKDGTYLLSGEKTYLTNGPIADLFIVVAKTGEDRVSGTQGQSRNRFTAFLVPKRTAGLKVTEPLHLDVFRPSPHGGIILENCSLPESSILGRKDAAYEEMVKPFRPLEDVLMMGPMVGAMTRQLGFLLDLLRRRKVPLPSEQEEKLGRLQSLIHCLRIVAYETSAMMDTRQPHTELNSLLLAFRLVSRDTQTILEQILTESGVDRNLELDRMSRDLSFAIEMGRNVARIKQRKLGQSLLSRKENHETNF